MDWEHGQACSSGGKMAKCWNIRGFIPRGRCGERLPWRTETVARGAQTGKSPGRLISQCKFVLNFKKTDNKYDKQTPLKNKQQDVSTSQQREHWPGEQEWRWIQVIESYRRLHIVGREVLFATSNRTIVLVPGTFLVTSYLMKVGLQVQRRTNRVCLHHFCFLW